jgi:hypothetical protein
VELPEHVHAITKPNGRRYFLFSKFRRTEREWPRVRILDEPLTEGFARRIAQLPRLKAVKAESGAWPCTFWEPKGTPEAVYKIPLFYSPFEL